MEVEQGFACKNCHEYLHDQASFCPSCGQSARVHRLNMTHISHDITHAFLHADKGFLYLVKELLFRPGIVAREYVDGKRKKYFNPFSFLTIVVAVSAFFVSSFNLMDADTNATNKVSQLINRHFNLIIFFSVPVVAFFSWLMFRKHGNYAEHLAFAAFLSGERSVLFTLIIVPLWIFFREWYYPVLYFYMTAYFIYYAWACMQFTGKYNAGTFLKGLLVNIFTQVIISVIIISSVIIYYKFFFERP